MKGLIIKDLMCLRKQRVTFIYIVISVLVVSVMYVLSAQFGNMAMLNQDMMMENSMTEIDIKNLSTMVLILFMLLPISMVGDVSAVFAADGKAGFINISSVMPVSIEKRVLSKYITIAVFFGIGVAVDLAIACILSILTNIISFQEFLGIIIVEASVMFVYGSLMCVYMFVLGYGKESYAALCSVLSIILALVLMNFDKLKMFFTSIITEQTDLEEYNPLELVTDFIWKYDAIAFPVAVVIGILSYVLSVVIEKRKRGIV